VGNFSRVASDRGGVGPDDLVIVTKPRDVKAGDEVKPRQEKAPPGHCSTQTHVLVGHQNGAAAGLPVSGPSVVVTVRYPEPTPNSRRSSSRAIESSSMG